MGLVELKGLIRLMNKSEIHIPKSEIRNKDLHPEHPILRFFPMFIH